MYPAGSAAKMHKAIPGDAVILVNRVNGARVKIIKLIRFQAGNNEYPLFFSASLNLTIEELLTEPYRDLATSVLLYHV